MDSHWAVSCVNILDWKNNMDDQTIHELAAKVDQAIIDWCMQSQAGPLTLSGIILARLTWINDMVNDGKDFRDLCRFISDRPQVKQSVSYPEPLVNDLDQAQELLRRFSVRDDDSSH